MDLRKLKKPNNIDELVSQKNEKTSRWYQPFIFRNDLITGMFGPTLGANSFVCTREDPEELRKAFLSGAIKLGNFYDKLNRLIIEAIPTAQKILEIACNAGHLCFDLTRQGKQVTGVDHWKSSYEIVKNITNVEFEYLKAIYNIKTHNIPELSSRTFDIVITVNFANHIIDIPYFIDYVGSKATKGILFICIVIHDETPFLKLRIQAGKKDNSLLHRFEYFPTSSAIELMLYSLNFKYVYSYSYCNDDPKYIKNWGIWVVSHDEVPKEVIQKYKLSLIKNKIEDYSEEWVGGLSISKKKAAAGMTPMCPV